MADLVLQLLSSVNTQTPAENASLHGSDVTNVTPQSRREKQYPELSATEIISFYWKTADFSFIRRYVHGVTLMFCHSRQKKIISPESACDVAAAPRGKYLILLDLAGGPSQSRPELCNWAVKDLPTTANLSDETDEDEDETDRGLFKSLRGARFTFASFN